MPAGARPAAAGGMGVRVVPDRSPVDDPSLTRAPGGGGPGGRRVSELPSGAVTFLFSDIEGSTRLVKTLRGRYGHLPGIGDRNGEVETLNDLGTLQKVRGDLRQAVSCHRQALDLARQIGSSRDEAHALAGLGQCEMAAGRISSAEGRLRQALEIFQRIGAAEAADVSAELQALTYDRPATQGP